MRLPSSSNFRTVGGPARSLRNLYRSDHLGALVGADAAQIRALGISRVLDFRGVQERAPPASRLNGLQLHSPPMEPTIVQKPTAMAAAGQRLEAADIVAHMQETYRNFVRQGTPRFAEFFRHLLASDQPTVFHCRAARDRPGSAAAMPLKGVGASDEEVWQDYLLTNDRLQLPARTRLALAPEAMQVLWRVQPGFLQAALDEVDARYGSLEGYFREGLGLGEAQRRTLRALYLPD